MRIFENSKRFLGQRILDFFSIENIREFKEISRSENALLFLHWEYPRIQREYSVRDCITISPLRISENSTRFLGQSMLFFFSIESFRELNEISRSENALLLLHWELSRIERDFSVRECSSISILRKSENKTRFLDHRIIFFFSIENISEFSEIARKVNALLFLFWEYQRIQHDFSFRECSSVPPLRISEYSTRFLGQRMLYYLSIENIRELNEIYR